MTMDIDLFPETIQAQPINIEAGQWQGQMLDPKWQQPLIEIRLLPVWSELWTVGWFIQCGNCVDEWHPRNPKAWRAHSSYPWHRIDQMPQGLHLATGMANAARAVRLVLAQMITWCPPEMHADITQVSDAIEAQARQWLHE
jgi:hypothetical protein